MFSIFETTTSLMPTTTSLNVSNFTLNDDGNINKNHFIATMGLTSAVMLTNAYQEAKYNAVLRKYANAVESESYLESLSDEELELALEKLGLLEEEAKNGNISLKI